MYFVVNESVVILEHVNVFLTKRLGDFIECRNALSVHIILYLSWASLFWAPTVRINEVPPLCNSAIQVFKSLRDARNRAERRS